MRWQLLASLQEVEIEEASLEAAVDWLQQWGTTIAFGCEVPFPAPLQADAVEDGVRLAFISVPGGVVTVIGELYLEIDGRRIEADGIASVCVTRVSNNPEQALPGEKEVLRALRNALKCGPDLCRDSASAWRVPGLNTLFKSTTPCLDELITVCMCPDRRRATTKVCKWRGSGPLRWPEPWALCRS